MRYLVKNGDSWRMMWIAQWESHLKMENTSFVKSTFGSSNVGMPDEQVILQWSGSHTNSWYFLILNFFEVFQEPLVRISLILLVDSSPHNGLVGGSSSLLHNIYYKRRYLLTIKYCKVYKRIINIFG